ncbi:ATP-binding protein [Ancylothrix sp. C2]|uniref:ATP-binding protein n=1 Tax=Ancylothrix sp. D3o TaxID=2953691 RepID=UPI0021BA981C|nr:ATP-binding protein [Ancylothrix sp. D3o]MCT7950389.1 ATP-binding protein [Ancylothrix sp. D3o]
MTPKFKNSGALKNSIAFSYLWVAGSFLVVIQLIFGAVNGYRQFDEQLDDLNGKAMMQARLLSSSSTEALKKSDLGMLQTLVQQMAGDSDFAYSKVVNGDGQTLAEFLNRENFKIAELRATNQFSNNAVVFIGKVGANSQIREIRVPIRWERMTLGEVRLGYSTVSAEKRLLKSLMLTGVQSLVVSGSVVLLTVFLFNRFIRKPLQDLAYLAQSLTGVVENHNFESLQPIVGSYDDEIGNLKSAFNGMVSQLQQTVFNLEQRITERARTEEALQQSYNLLQAVIEGTTDLIYVKNTQGRYVLINSAVAGVLGRSREEIIGKDDLELLSPETARLIMTSDRKIMIRGATQTVEEMVLVRGDESLDNVSSPRIYLTKKDVYRDPDGRVIGLICVARDITERKQTEEALRLSAKQLKEQATQLEHTLAELQRTQAHLVQSEKMSSLGQLVAGIAHEINNPVNFIYGNLSHTETYFEELLKLVQLYQDHCPQPGPEIEEYLNEIEMDFIAEDVPRILSSMKNGAERISQMVLSLRNFSRLDEAKAKWVDIHEGIDNTLLILSNRLTQEKISVFKNYGELPTIECNAASLNQVFLNILTNAIDALVAQNKDGVITICTELKENLPAECGEFSSLSSCHTWAVIRIADNGPGISPAMKHKIFDPFFTTKPVGKGTGLGLSICHQIIEKHGGHIWLNSEPGEGAELAIMLPLKHKPVASVSL